MRRIAGITFLLVLLASCSPKEHNVEISPLLSTVPSRSAAVMHFSRCADALALLLDSTSVFRSLDLGHLGNSEMILSYGYSAGLVPLLALDAGRASSDTSSAAAKLLESAGGKRLKSFYTAELLPKRAVVLLSPSQAAIDEAVQHIRSGSSILDAEGFRKALDLQGNGKGTVFLRNGAAARLVPRDMLNGFFQRRELVSFFSGLAEWTVLNFAGWSREDISVAFQDPGSGRYLSGMFAGLGAGDCTASSAIPDSSEFVLGLCLEDSKAYLQAWEECLDVRAELSRYKGRLASLRKSTGRNPAAWWAEKSPREIVRVRWNGHEALLLRPSKKPKAAGAAENPCPGFVPALLGDAFRIADDGMCASAGGWLVFGSADDVAAWLEAPKGAVIPGNPRKAKCYLINPGFSLVADSKNTVLNVN